MTTLRADSAAELRTKRRVTWIGAVVNLLLAGLKLAAGLLGGALTLVSDGVHSLSDVVSDAVVLLGVRFAARPADDEHPWGHGRIETLTAFVLGLILVGAAVALGWSGLRGIRHPEPVDPSWWAAGAALFSLAAKEALFRWTRAVGRRTNSRALIANAWHHRSDALSSLVALAAVSGAILLPEWDFLDPLGSLLVGLMILVVGVRILLDAARELIDTGVEEELRRKLGGIVTGVAGVERVVSLEARRMGPSLAVELTVAVDPEMDVFQAHRITEFIDAQLRRKLARIGKVMIHVEPCREPERLDAAANTRLRRAINAAGRAVDGVRELHDLRLHRRATGVAVDLSIELDAGLPLERAHRIAAEVQLRLTEIEGVGRVMVGFEPRREPGDGARADG